MKKTVSQFIINSSSPQESKSGDQIEINRNWLEDQLKEYIKDSTPNSILVSNYNSEDQEFDQKIVNRLKAT